MNKRCNSQDKARIVMEFINTSILLLSYVASTTSHRSHSKTGKTNSWQGRDKPWRPSGCGQDPYKGGGKPQAYNR